MSGPQSPSGEAALAREFEAQRPRLLRLAYASTGSLAEAEDCVQEAWLRLQRAADRGDQGPRRLADHDGEQARA
jgi:DNA-directed RNA polymerase specialized sigma24 family protein